MNADPLPDWKAELDAIVGARHGGQVAGVASRLEALDTRFPNTPEIAFQRGWTADMLGDAAQAVRHYERAIALGLAPNDHAAALIGLATALRLSGQTTRAVEMLEAGKRQFPEYREFDLYLAIALHAAGRSAEAVQGLIDTLLEISDDPGLAAHQRALRYHAANLTAGTAG